MVEDKMPASPEKALRIEKLSLHTLFLDASMLTEVTPSPLNRKFGVLQPAACAGNIEMPRRNIVNAQRSVFDMDDLTHSRNSTLFSAEPRREVDRMSTNNQQYTRPL